MFKEYHEMFDKKDVSDAKEVNFFRKNLHLYTTNKVK